MRTRVFPRSPNLNQIPRIRTRTVNRLVVCTRHILLHGLVINDYVCLMALSFFFFFTRATFFLFCLYMTASTLYPVMLQDFDLNVDVMALGTTEQDTLNSIGLTYDLGKRDFVKMLAKVIILVCEKRQTNQPS